MTTPWNKVLRKMGMSQRKLAMTLGCDPSTIANGKRRSPGTISPRLQVRLKKLAEEIGVELAWEDFLPG